MNQNPMRSLGGGVSKRDMNASIKQWARQPLVTPFFKLFSGISPVEKLSVLVARRYETLYT